MKRLLVPLAVLLFSVVFITSCSSGAPASSTPSTTSPPKAATTTGAPPPTSQVPALSSPLVTSTAPAPPKTTSTTGVSKYGGTLRFVSSTPPGTPIGWLVESIGAPAYFTMELSLQNLLKEQLDGSLTPNLAASYDVNSDPANPSVTFHLQKGVKFSDGTDFNAQAVKWNFDQIKSGGVNAGTYQFWKSFDVLDDYTIRVNMTTWQNRLVRSFADGVANQVSPSAYQKNGLDWLRYHMVGTGPFVQTNYQQSVSLTTTRNPNYWETGKPYLDGVQILYVVDPMTAEALFKSGGADAIDCNSNGLLAYHLQSAGYKIITQLGGPMVLVPDSLNADSPWANQKVRQAAEYAIDKESITKTFGYGFDQPAYQVNNPTSLAYDPKLPGRKYDVAKAKQLLTEAGYPNGFKSTIIAGPQGLNKDIVAAIQAYLAKIGIQVDLQFPEAAAWSQIATSGTWHNAVLYYNLPQWANPNTGFNISFGVPRSSGLQSVKKPDGWADLINASLVTPKPDPAATQKCEDALYNDVTVIPLTYGVAEFAITDKVQDSYLGTRGGFQWWEPQNTWLKP